MADQKISALTANPGIDGTEEMPTAKAGSNFKNTLTALKTWLQGVLGFSNLVDTYDLSTAPAFSVPVNNSGTLIPANIYDTTPIIVDAATTAALAGTWTYANGAAGVGATLTRTTNSAFETQDGITAAPNRKYLIKNWTGANRLRNGVYTLTTVGSAGAAAVLTRATDADTQAELDGQIVLVSAGTTLRGSSWRQTTSLPTVGTSNIVYQTNAVAAPSVAPTSITVAAAQALITAGTVVVGRVYAVTDSTQVSAAGDIILVRGATPDSFTQEGTYIVAATGVTNDVLYTLDAVPTDYIIFRRDNQGNEIWDIGGYGTLAAFPWNNGSYNSNKISQGLFSFAFAGTFTDNKFSEVNVSDGAFTGATISGNIGSGSGTSLTIAANNAQIINNIIGTTSALTSSGRIKNCIIGPTCTIDDGGFVIDGCIFLPNTVFTATANISNAIIGLSSAVDSTAGDAATIDAMSGTFRKDTSGTTFTLTNSYITANSKIMWSFMSDPGNSNSHNVHVVPGAGSAVFTFELAPSNNTDVCFVIFN